MNKVVPISSAPLNGDRRKYPRVSDAIALRLNDSEPDASTPLDSTPTHIVKLSCGGLRFLHDEPIEANTAVLLSLHLPGTGKTVHLNSRVISSGEEKSRTAMRYFVQVEFQNPDTQTRQQLKDHIEFVSKKTGTTHRDMHYIA